MNLELLSRTTEFMLSHPVPYIAVILTVSYVVFKIQQNNRPTSDFEEMVESRDYKHLGTGLSALRQRGVDISDYIYHIIAMLESENRLDRCASQGMLKKYYPDAYRLIERTHYMGSESLERCQEKLRDLHDEYGRPKPDVAVEE